MSQYLSRGELHRGSSEDMLAGWSERQKDRYAEMVLAVVREARKGPAVHRRTDVQMEPTGIRVDRDVEDAVMKRSA